MNRLGWAALTLAATLTSAGIARADTFVLTNTHHSECGFVVADCSILDGNGYVETEADGSTTLVGPDSGNPGLSPQDALIMESQRPINTTTYFATALQAETLILDFKYQDFDTFGPCYDAARQMVNGQQVAFLCQELPQPYFGHNDPQFGEVTFNLKLGDSYGFEIISDSSEGAGVFNFKLVSSTVAGDVPEPETWALMLAGFGLIGVAIRRRPFMAAARPTTTGEER